MKGVNQYTYKNPDEKVLKEIVEYLKENTIKDTCNHFNISRTQFYTLRDKKLLNYESLLNENKRFNNKKNIGFKHSEETKKLLSEKRKKWIAENPDKSPYLLSHKSRGETYPEKYFRKWLEKEKISFKQEYRYKLYAFDFLINDRIDLEIDGTQHRNDKRIIEHDIRRDKEARNAGFKVYRIPWADYCKLDRDSKRAFLNDLKNFFNSSSECKIPDYVISKKINKPRKFRPGELRKKFFNDLKRKIKNKKNIAKYYDYREYMAIEMIKNGKSIYDVCKIMYISYKTICKWIKKHNELNLLPTPRLKVSGVKPNWVPKKIIKKTNERCLLALKMLAEGKSYLEVAKKFDVSDNSIRKWIRSLGKNPKDYGHNKNNRKNNSGLKIKLLNNESELIHY